MPILELHNASTDWEFGVGLAFLFILFECFLVDDGCLVTGKVCEEWSTWIKCLNNYVVIVNDFNCVDHFSHELNLWHFLCTFKGELNVFSVEVITVVELNAFTELELVSEIVYYFVFFSETWLEFTSFCLTNEEGVVDVTESCCGGCVVYVVWVETNNVRCLSDNDVLTCVICWSCWFIGASCCCCVACWSCCCSFFLSTATCEHCEHHCHNEC